MPRPATGTAVAPIPVGEKAIRHRIASRTAADELARHGLAPVAWIPSRSAPVARAAARRVPLAVSEPDSSLALAYAQLVEQLEEVNAR
jgi:MinD-like ATPase involved in chromosome partitioning or flagellar assembly